MLVLHSEHSKYKQIGTYLSRSLYTATFFFHASVSIRTIHKLSKMNETPCNIYIAISTQCGSTYESQTSTATLEGIHTGCQEILGLTVKEFRKKIIAKNNTQTTTMEIDHKERSADAELLTPQQIVFPTLLELQDELKTLRFRFEVESEMMKREISFLSDTLKQNNIRHREAPKPWRLI